MNQWRTPRGPGLAPAAGSAAELVDRSALCLRYFGQTAEVAAAGRLVSASLEA